MTPSSGIADWTVFSFDTSEIAAINEHINRELRVASSTSQVSINFGKFVYPDNSEVGVPSSNFGSTIIPNYNIDIASFSATFRLVLTVNGQQREGDLATLTVA